MGGTNFDNEMKIPDSGAFVAEGTVEPKYEGLTRMNVGVIQLKGSPGNLEITGAAYGVGTPEWKQGSDPSADSDGWENATAAGNTIRVRRWAMQLRGDYEHPLHPGPAVGFVLGEMPGGKVTGWIEDGLTLTGGPKTRLAMSDTEREIYKAALSPEQQKVVDTALDKLKEADVATKDAEEEAAKYLAAAQRAEGQG